MTSGVQASIQAGNISHADINSCLRKHFNNKGEECEDDNNLNAWSIKHKDGRVLSVFNNVGIDKIYIITDGLHLADDPVYGSEYPVTTILYADEY